MQNLGMGGDMARTLRVSNSFTGILLGNIAGNITEFFKKNVYIYL